MTHVKLKKFQLYIINIEKPKEFLYINAFRYKA
nr:MAG TPA: hypothetical protein [Caudoviricetes sp.]